MAKVWLVGEEGNGVRTLLHSLPLRVGSFNDVEAAFQQRQFVLLGTTGYLLKEADITAPVQPDVSIERQDLLKYLSNDMAILYRVLRSAGPPT